MSCLPSRLPNSASNWTALLLPNRCVATNHRCETLKPCYSTCRSIRAGFCTRLRACTTMWYPPILLVSRPHGSIGDKGNRRLPLSWWPQSRTSKSQPLEHWPTFCLASQVDEVMMSDNVVHSTSLNNDEILRYSRHLIMPEVGMEASSSSSAPR